MSNSLQPNSPQPQQGVVRQALMELKNEHAEILGHVQAMLDAPDTAALLPILETLHGVLMRHFAHEEYPDGLYHSMGALTSEHRKDLRELVDDHFVILSTLRGMIERAKLQRTETLAADVQALSERLRAHETHEHALAASLIR